MNEVTQNEKERDDAKMKNDLSYKGSDLAGIANADLNTAALETTLERFHARQGHGYAAEQANNLYDKLVGKDAVVVGNDNAKDGSDRLVNNVNIQTKYCQTATASVDAAFNDSGVYRYFNSDGTPMNLEVPPEQYGKAVEAMAKKIQNGKVPGVSDPSKASELIKKGNFTYEQAKNIAKFGTVESLTFDAANSAVIAANAFGITATLTFAKSIWNGDPIEIAIENAAYSGIKVGGISFISSVAVSQLARTGALAVLNAPTATIVKALGSKTSAAIANSFREGANIYGAAAGKSAAKLLRSNIATAIIVTAVMSIKDISHAFSQKISGKQLFKNVTTISAGVAGGIAGGSAGAVAGTAIFPGVGTVVGFVAGSMVGGTAASKATNLVIGAFIEDDSVEMVRIIEKTYCQLAVDYVLSQEEVDISLDALSRSLNEGSLLDMFASSDREVYADRLCSEQIEKITRSRCMISMPSESDFIDGIEQVFIDAEAGTGIFDPNKKELDAVAVGKAITGVEYEAHVAKKAMYVTKQMNIAQSNAEGRMQKMQNDNLAANAKLKEIYEERDEIKKELNQLLEK